MGLERTALPTSWGRIGLECLNLTIPVGASGDSGLGAGVLRKKSIQRCAIFFFADHSCYYILLLVSRLLFPQRYKRAVDAAWTVGPATTIEQSYPLGGSSPCR